MDTPGYDPVATTGQIAGGAQVVVFTTGRGSAFGSKPAPTIKVATNDRLYAQMPDDMDINCGDIVSQGVTIQAKGARDPRAGSSPSPPARRPRARRSASATTSSSPGRSAR